MEGIFDKIWRTFYSKKKYIFLLHKEPWWANRVVGVFVKEGINRPTHIVGSYFIDSILILYVTNSVSLGVRMHTLGFLSRLLSMLIC